VPMSALGFTGDQIDLGFELIDDKGLVKTLGQTLESPGIRVPDTEYLIRGVGGIGFQPERFEIVASEIQAPLLPSDWKDNIIVYDGDTPTFVGPKMAEKIRKEEEQWKKKQP